MKLTPEILEGLVRKASYFTHGTLTLCVVDLVNGASVVGQSNVLDPANYDANIGRVVAYKDAVEKLWQLEGYAIKTRGH